MDEKVRQMHLSAGQTYGREATCGKKIDYGSEETATRSAEKMTVKFGRSLEPYPCFFCGGGTLVGR